MIKLNGRALLIAAMLCGAVLFAGCSSPTTSNNGGVETPKQPTNGTTKTDAAPAGDKVGVPECDNYIAKYEACLTAKVPEAQRGMLKSAFESQRKGFKDAAADPVKKATLPSICTKITETAKTQMAAFKCDW